MVQSTVMYMNQFNVLYCCHYFMCYYKKKNTPTSSMGCILCSEIDWVTVDPFDHSVLNFEQDDGEDDEDDAGAIWMLNISDDHFSISIDESAYSTTI